MDKSKIRNANIYKHRGKARNNVKSLIFFFDSECRLPLCPTILFNFDSRLRLRRLNEINSKSDSKTWGSTTSSDINYKLRLWLRIPLIRIKSISKFSVIFFLFFILNVIQLNFAELKGHICFNRPWQQKFVRRKQLAFTPVGIHVPGVVYFKQNMTTEIEKHWICDSALPSLYSIVRVRTGVLYNPARGVFLYRSAS